MRPRTYRSTPASKDKGLPEGTNAADDVRFQVGMVYSPFD